ncbi:hypothetical protein [Actinomadura sp. WMMA1423]|uniref:hypothetical protein n=1 Tax=Actinomadura sp. WMMA1423 TaxID=2591108 RepID=UPI00114662D5|nr:hypothetical protein [Actinomadura sp. WMMA1423]
MTDQTTTSVHAQHIADMREAVATLRTTEPDRNSWDALDKLVDFAEQQGLHFNPDTHANLWGFGSVRVVLSEPDGGFWVRLFSLIEPTGLDDVELYRLFLEELAEQDQEGREDDHPSVHLIEAGDARDLLVHHDFVMRVFATHSPWRKEYFENTKELMHHAMEKSGLLGIFGASPTGFTAIAHLTTEDGEAIKLSMPIRRFDADEVPIVAAPFDDAAEGEEMRITDMTSTYEICRADDAARSIFGPKVDEGTATEMAFRGPALTAEQ